MTIDALTYQLSFAGSGTTGPFSITFRVYETADVAAVLVVDATGRRTQLENGVDFTVTITNPADLPSVCTVSTTSAVAAGETLICYQARTKLQGMDLPTTGKLLNERFEQGLDTAAMNHIGHLYERQLRFDQQKKLAIAGVAADVTLDAAEANYPYISVAGSPGAETDLVFPASEEHVCYCRNGFGDSSNLVVKAAGAGTSVTIAAGAGAWVWSDGTNVEELA